MGTIATALNAVSANVTGPWIDWTDAHEDYTLEVITAGTVSAFSVQFQGSIDKTDTFSLGSAITTVSDASVTGKPCRYIRAVLSGYTGTGTVTARVARGADS
jgi:hypothetical protein